DVSRHRERLAALEQKTAQPNFWQDPEQAQKILQQRKAAEGRIAADEKLQRLASDLKLTSTWLMRKPMPRSARRLSRRSRASSTPPTPMWPNWKPKHCSPAKTICSMPS